MVRLLLLLLDDDAVRVLAAFGFRLSAFGLLLSFRLLLEEDQPSQVVGRSRRARPLVTRDCHGLYAPT